MVPGHDAAKSAVIDWKNAPTKIAHDNPIPLGEFLLYARCTKPYPGAGFGACVTKSFLSGVNAR